MSQSSNTNQRVVVTGLGVVSSLGIGWQDFWKNLIAGKSGISKIESFDVSDYDRQLGGEVKNFNPEEFINTTKSNLIGRASQMAMTACILALKDAGIDIEDMAKNKSAVCLGTTTGEQGLIEQYNDSVFQNIHDFKKALMPAIPSSSISSNVAQRIYSSGPDMMFSTACAAGNYATGYAYDLIKRGGSDLVVAGGADGFSRLVFTGFCRLFAVAPEKCQPFDKNRQGMIPAEGAGIMILESLESAEKRKAKIYAEILGYGMSCDASHMTNPTVDGIYKSIKKSLDSAGIKPDQVDYISAHGTGTRENDRAESQAIHQVFNSRGSEIPVSSIKSMLGHTMGAAAALESIACCLAIKYGKIPPTINFIEKDSTCNVNCVPNKNIDKEVKIALNNSQAFGGNNTCVVLKKCKF